MPTLYLPDLLYTEGTFRPGLGLLVGDDGSILRIGADLATDNLMAVKMPGKAILPGLVNGHSHSFQRLIRGVAEHCGPNGDDFWAWRNTMYRAASQLEPDDVFDVARMTFLEMALSGITAVGEFHYVHRRQDGTPYDDPNLLAKRIIDAANSVGLRVCLLRVAYARAGYELPPNPGQQRFYESCEEYLESVDRLADDLRDESSTVSMGVAPHSIRAVTLESLKRISAWAEERNLPVHMHIAEQVAEIAACEREYGLSPIRLLAQNGLLSDRLTLVHAIHTSPDEVEALAKANVTICSCPTTERNLGDGIIDAEKAIEQGILFSFGSDSQATINLLEDARELDYHLRLKRQRRVLLDGIDGEDMAARLFRYATAGGAGSLRMETGLLEPGRPADFFSVDLQDVSIAGVAPEELLSMIVFSLERTAVRDVVMNGRAVVTEGRHALADEIVSRYREVAVRTISARS
ncbi:formimidoylglutamate deiminase [Granulicella sp. S156]|uniref:formimidoylglutamate deiminase n=1 Tax=Granulicella sp. S156 TaxID=1747224 RepID=UPI00131C5911|nr:formimidoylglutamate deiminase [Granulicella sp. S156]